MSNISLNQGKDQIQVWKEYIPIVDVLFDKLKVEPKVLVQELDLSENSVRRVLKKLSEENNYITRHGTDRNTIYYFNKLVDIIE